MNILIVDDEIDQLQSLKRGLRNKGYGVFEALNANDALSIMEHKFEDIDLVLTDHYMQGKSGVELLDEIRSRFGLCPVIIMSAYGTEELALKTMEHGGDRFIEKPFTLSKLIAEIQKVLREKKAAGCVGIRTKQDCLK